MTESNETETVREAGAEVDDGSSCDSEFSKDVVKDEKLVPVSEAIRYRRRAQLAEQLLSEASEELKDAKLELSEVRQTMDHIERRQKIDALLVSEQAADLEVARLLTEMAVESMDEPDIMEAVTELRRHKPYLFTRPVGVHRSAMGSSEHAQVDARVSEAADHAADSGNRRDLLRYLRLRRKD